MKILILKGLPASGKSTWAREYCSENKDWVRVNRDDLRNMRGDYWVPKQEKMITLWEDACIDAALSSGLNVILDATNLNNDRNKSRISKIREKHPKLKSEAMMFDVEVDTCIARDLARNNPVGEKVIRGMYDKYLAPDPVVYSEDTSLPECVVFDVDGTLAKMDGRSPYDWHRVGEDKPNKGIVDMCKAFASAGTRIIIFTGRDGVCLPETEGWLKKHSIPYDEIYIRPEGSTEKDAIIKKRMFEENIRGKYYCMLMVDDRDQVVKMWRKELGLTCAQADYGNF